MSRKAFTHLYRCFKCTRVLLCLVCMCMRWYDNFSNMFKLYVILFIFIYYHWNRRTFNLAKATGSHSSSSSDDIFFIYLSTSCGYCRTPLFISCSSSSENAVVNSCNLIWAVSVQMAVSLHPSPFLSSFHSDGYFLFCTVAPSPFLSLSMSQNKNNFQGRQRNRSRWQKIRMTAALAMWLIFQSFSLFSLWYTLDIG